MLKVESISGGYSQKNILCDLSFEVKKGEFLGILGPNGSGKTTLLKMLTRILQPSEGNIYLHQRPLHSYTSKELAMTMAVLPQMNTEFFAYTVRETVSLGRYARRKGLLAGESPEDKRIISEAMNITGIEQYSDTHLQALSGGERQRVFLAQALAQEPDILLLDEPTNHLDLSFQKELLDQLKKWTHERNMTVISIFHDVNIAGLYSDRVMLLQEGKIQAIGRPEDVITEERIQTVYQTNITKVAHPHVHKPQIFLDVDLHVLEQWRIDDIFIKEEAHSLRLQFPMPLKVYSSVVHDETSWKQTFLLAESEQDTAENYLFMPIHSTATFHYGAFGHLVFISTAKRDQEETVLIAVHGQWQDLSYTEVLLFVSQLYSEKGKFIKDITIAVAPGYGVIQKELLYDNIRQGFTELWSKGEK